MSETGSLPQDEPRGISIDFSRGPDVSGGDIERELTKAPLDASGRRLVSRLEVSDTRVRDHVVIEHARIGWLDFLRTTIETGVTFRKLDLNEARLHTATVTGEVVIEDCTAEALILDGIVFEAPVRINLTAQRIVCERCDFRAGLDLLAARAEITLDGTRFGAPSVVTTLGAGEEPPHVASVRRANLDGLLLSGVRLDACRFVKAYNLDRLRLENDVVFARTGFWRATPRRVLSEEAHWRAERQGWPWTEFYEQAAKPPAWLIEKDNRLESAFEPGLVASIYRSLRKGREDAKDEPGAADFYYGEMEMRRHDETAPLAERAILWLYWLVSGYGLRASRAFAALLAAVVVFAVLLDLWGFDPDRNFGHALLVSVQSTTALLRGITEPLTTTGEWVVTALRLLGPLLFGLMLLSLRGRVKR